jgi:hypothetical protein
VVYRPRLQAPARPVNMVAQKVDERHPIVRPAAAIPVRSERNALPAVRSATPAVTPRGAQSEPTRTERGAIVPRTTAAPRAPLIEPKRVESQGAGNTRPNVTSPAPAKATERAVAPTTTARPTAAPRPPQNELKPPGRVGGESRPTVSAPAATPRPESGKQIPRSVTPAKPESAAPPSPLRTSPQTQRPTPAASGINTRDYYPKSYHQAAEIRGSSAASARQNPAEKNASEQPKKDKN